MRRIDEIIVHCSATREGSDFHAHDIDRWHRLSGYEKIGYHFVVTIDGSVEAGRREEEVGAHCKGWNANSIGVCYVGGLDEKGKPKDTRTDAQKRSLLHLLRWLRGKYPAAKISGHRDHEGVNKACPCFDAGKEYRDLC